MAVIKKFSAVKKVQKHLLGIQNLSIQEANLILDEAKNFIKLKIDEGWSDNKIKSFLISKYGKEILATPQKKGSDLFLWIIPIIVLVFGVITYWSLYKTIRLKIKREHN